MKKSLNYVLRVNIEFVLISSLQNETEEAQNQKLRQKRKHEESRQPKMEARPAARRIARSADQSIHHHWGFPAEVVEKMLNKRSNNMLEHACWIFVRSN